MAGAKGSILADTKIYFDEFQWWQPEMTTRISQGLAQQVCYILEHANTWISVLRNIFHIFSSCFIAWNDGGEKNGTCAGGAATEARSPSTVRQHLHGSLVEGVQHICGSRNVHKVGAENMQLYNGCRQT